MRSTATVLALMAACAGVVDGRGRWAAVRRLGALVAGAVVAAALLDPVRWVVPVLAAVLLGVAVALRWFSGQERQEHQERDGDERGAGDGAQEGPEEREAFGPGG